MIKIDLTNETSLDIKGILKDYRNIAKVTQGKVNKKGTFEVSVTIVDKETIHDINKKYRNIDRPTDVISFAFLDEVEGEININYGDHMFLLGEILISLDQAKLQAEEYKHSLHREICFLFIHGLLHLLGYDHQNEEQEKGTKPLVRLHYLFVGQCNFICITHILKQVANNIL